MPTTGGGAQEERFVGGSQLVAIRVADQLGRAVRLSHPVRTIARRGHGVRVIAARLRGSATGMLERDAAEGRGKPGLPGVTWLTNVPAVVTFVSLASTAGSIPFLNDPASAPRHAS
jgi:hypothetical protein